VIPAPFIVVVDANVLFPLTLRDTMLRAAAEDFYQLRWSEDILDEMERNLVSTNTMTADKAARLRATMEAYFPEALVVGYESLVAAMPNDAKDRHVVAAAVKAGGSGRHDRESQGFHPPPRWDRGAVAGRVSLQPVRSRPGVFHRDAPQTGRRSAEAPRVVRGSARKACSRGTRPHR
jgi:hypothetical protein